MDLFNKKRIVELERKNANLNRRLEQWENDNKGVEAKMAAQRNQIEYLVRTIRQMDDAIFSMSQMTSWDSMRPRFAQLVDQMTARKVAESNRIGDILRTELVDTYNDQTNVPKRIGK